MNVDYWAQISRDDATKTSPAFASEREMFAWVKSNMRIGDEVHPWKREITDGGFRDVSLTTRDEIPPDKERLAKLLVELRDTIDAGRVLAKPSGRTYRTDAQRGAEARARLERAGQAVKDSEAV